MDRSVGVTRILRFLAIGDVSSACIANAWVEASIVPESTELTKLDVTAGAVVELLEFLTSP